MYNVMCPTCHKLVRIMSLYGSRCPKCFQLIRLQEDEYEEKKHDDGTSILVPLALMSTFSPSSDYEIHSSPSPDFEPGGGSFGGAGASESYDSDSGGGSSDSGGGSSD